MPAPLVAALVPAIFEIGKELIDKLWPDADAADEAKAKMLLMLQQGEFKQIEAALQQLQLEAADRANARQREISTGDVWTPRLLAGLLTVGFFAVLGWLLMNGAPEQGGEALLVLLGALSAGFAAVLAYYFGSSQGSATKGATLERIAERQP